MILPNILQIIPALFAATYAPLEVLNIMQLPSPQSAILSMRDFQCADHHRADTAGDERRSL